MKFVSIVLFSFSLLGAIAPASHGWAGDGRRNERRVIEEGLCEYLLLREEAQREKAELRSQMNVLELQKQEFIKFRKQVRDLEVQVAREQHVHFMMDPRLVAYLYESYGDQKDARLQALNDVQILMNEYAKEILRTSYDFHLEYSVFLVLKVSGTDASIEVYRRGRLLSFNPLRIPHLN